MPNQGFPCPSGFAQRLVDEAIEVWHGRPDPLATRAKMLRFELLEVKADAERVS
jgi:hypothetical protein